MKYKHNEINFAGSKDSSQQNRKYIFKINQICREKQKQMKYFWKRDQISRKIPKVIWYSLYTSSFLTWTALFETSKIAKL